MPFFFLTFYRNGNITGWSGLSLTGAGTTVKLGPSTRPNGVSGSTISFAGPVTLTEGAGILLDGNTTLVSVTFPSLSLSSTAYISVIGRAFINVVNDMTLGWYSVLSADGGGYALKKGPGAVATGSSVGGAYGGPAGGTGTTTKGGTVLYGDMVNPVDMGSGGSSAAGGGAIELIVGGTLTMDETSVISSNGASGDGAGAGGSLWLTASQITGAGTIHANGGDSTNTYSGSGGGGRVALFSNSASFAGNISAAAGYLSAGGQYIDWRQGAPGTVYTDLAGISQLSIDNWGRTSSWRTNLVRSASVLDVEIISVNGLAVLDLQDLQSNNPFTLNTELIESTDGTGVLYIGDSQGLSQVVVNLLFGIRGCAIRVWPSSTLNFVNDTVVDQSIFNTTLSYLSGLDVYPLYISLLV